MKRIFLTILSVTSLSVFCQNYNFVKTIREEGTEPISFVSQKLSAHDLIIFDDALHNAYEPFVFYQQLLKSDTTIDYVFIEVFGINTQESINQYLASPNHDSTILFPVFQNNFGGLGWNYETYFDLLKTVWKIRNKEKRNLEVIGVDQPIFWEGIRSRKDYDTFSKSLSGRDYFMYKVIVDKMENFKAGKKGIFLTNTRHAYKNISSRDGDPYWNSGTFFYKWHPGTTYAIRFHNVTLSIQAKKEPGTNSSIAGMDRIVYSWERMNEGAWDEAFQINGNKPVAIPLLNNPFGNTRYMGNHMLNCKHDQVMSDAYDAIIFLAPLENLHSSAKMSFFYTQEFKEELKRRIEILEGDDLESFLSTNEVISLDDFIEELSRTKPVLPSNLLAN